MPAWRSGEGLAAADHRSRTCRICLEANVDDMRHVSVGGLCDVNEAAEAKCEAIFREVLDDAAIWDATHRYPDGTWDRFVATQGPATADGIPHTRSSTIQDAINGIRLAEEQVSSLDGCKTGG